MPVFNSARLRLTPMVNPVIPTPAMEIGATQPFPAALNGPALNWSFQNVPGAWWQEMMRPCDGDPLFTYNAQVMAKFATTANNKLQMSPWADTAHPPGFSITGTLRNHVRGDATFVPMTYTSYASESDPGPVPYGPTVAEQAWPEPQGTVTLSTGSASVVGAGTKFLTKLANRPRVVIGDSYTFGDQSPPPFYQILSIEDDTHLTLASPYLGSPGSGIPMRGPWNRPPTGLDEMSSTDHHIICLIRDEATGNPAYLYEDFDCYSPDGGNSWFSTGGVKFDLQTGAQRKDGWTTSTAGGTPFYPFVVRYEEILAGRIDHPLRGIIGNGMCLTQKSVWPAKHGVQGGGTDWTAGWLPMGVRIRLNAAWWAANRSTFSATNQIIGDAMKVYGLHVNDLSPPNFSLWIDGFLDPRWDQTDLNRLKNIPVSAFEVCDFGPQTTLTLPATTPIGVSRTYTLTYNNTDNTVYNVDPYFRFVSPTGVVTLLNGPRITPTSRTTSVNFTPTTAGTWTLTNTLFNCYWLTENAKTFVVS